MCSVDSLLSCSEPTESVVPQLKQALKTKAIPAPSPISVQAVICGLLSQVLVSVVTGQEELKCALEFDVNTLNGTQFEYNVFSLCLTSINTASTMLIVLS